MCDNDGSGPTGWRWRDCLVAGVIGAIAMVAVGAAQAGDHWKPKKWHRHHAPYYVVVPPGAYYSPPPVVYAPPPPPVVVYPTPPVVAYPIHAGPPGGSISMGVTLPLR